MKIFQPYFLERYDDEVDHWVQDSCHPQLSQNKEFISDKSKRQILSFHFKCN